MNERVNELLKTLEERLSKIDRSELMGLLMGRAKHHHSYSLNNLLLAGLQLCRQQNRSFDLEVFSNLWLAPFPIWQRWGYRILRGSKALNVLTPFIAKKKIAIATEDHEAADNAEAAYHKKLVCFAIKPVFDVSQCEKLAPNASAPHRPTAMKNIRLGYPSLIARIEASGLRVVTLPLREDIGGYINGGVITVNRNNSEPARYCTLLHELAHQVHDHASCRNKENEAIQEIEAEATAYVIGNQLGIDIPSEFYISAWGADGQKIRKSLSKIDRAVRRISEILGLSDDIELEAAA